MMATVVVASVLVIFVAIVVITRRSRARAPRHLPQNYRLSSEATGVPQEIRDYDAPRRFARGSVPPPPGSRARVTPVVAPSPRPRSAPRVATPRPLDDRWDLSD